MQDEKPVCLSVSLKDVALMVVIQLGISFLAIMVVVMLPFDLGGGSWAGGLGLLIGAQVFGVLKEKKNPGILSKSSMNSIALRVAFTHVGLGILFVVLVVLVFPGIFPEIVDLFTGGTSEVVIRSVVLAGASFILAFFLSRLGLGMSLQAAKRTDKKT